MALTVNFVDVSPQEARRRLVYLQTKLWRDQYESVWFIRDVRSDIYLRNELIAFWQGRVAEIHGWTNIVGQFVDAIITPIHGALTWFWDNSIKPGLDAALAGLGWLAETARDLIVDAFKWAAQIGNWLWTFLEDVTAPIRDALSGVWDYLVTTVSGTLEAISGGLAALPQSIASAFQSAISFISDVIMGAGRRVASFFTWVGRETITILQTAFGWLWQLITDAANSFFSWLMGMCTQISQLLKRGEWQYAISLAVAWCGTGVTTTGTADLISTHIMGSGFNLRAVGSYLKRIFDPWLIISATVGALIYTSVRVPVTQFFNKLFRPTIPSVDDATRMLWRGKITTEDFREVCRRHGFDNTFIEAYVDLADVIPNIGDLIRFAVREAYPVATPQEQLNVMRVWAQRQGLSPYWADRYWIAHWQLPDFGSLREAFWRGIISADEFRKFILKHDYRPDPWPGHAKSDQDIMFDLSYALPGAIEQRWMLRWGLLTPEQLKDLTVKRGVHPDWVQKVADAIMRQTLADERTRLLSQLRILYREGQIAADAFVARLKALYFSDAEIMLIMEASDIERQRVVAEESLVRVREASRADYARAYRLGLIEEGEFRRALADLGYPTDVVAMVVDIENTLKAVEAERERKREMAELERQARELTRRDLCEAYKLGLVSEEEYVAHLKGMGYSDVDAARILALDKAKVEAARLRLEVLKHERLAREAARLTADERSSVKSALQSLYVHGMIAFEAMRSRLRAIGYADVEVALIVEAAVYRLQQTLLEKRIDAAVAEYRYGKISIEQLSARLAGLGLSTAFVQNILAFESARTRMPVESTPEEEVRGYGRGTVIKRYREGIITPVEFEQELRLLGYAPAEVTRIRVLADLERDYNMAVEAFNALVAGYRKGRISETRFFELAEAFGIQRDTALWRLSLEKLKLGIEVAG